MVGTYGDNTGTIYKDDVGVTAVVGEDDDCDKCDDNKDDFNCKRWKKNHEYNFYYYSNRFSINSWLKNDFFYFNKFSYWA